MNIIIIIGSILCIAAAIAAIAVPIGIRNHIEESYGISSEERAEKLANLRFPWRIPVIIVSLLIMVLLQAFVIIPTGYSGVKTVFGQVKEIPAHTGFNWKIPFVENIETICTKQQDQKIDDKIWSETKARTTIYYEAITVTYQINSEKTSWIYANVTNYEDNLINSGIVSSAVKASSKELDDVDATNRGKIQPLVAQKLQTSLNEKYGENTIMINMVIISNAEFEDSYNKAIAAKQQAILEQEKQATENQTKVAKAQAEADAKYIAAEGTKKANELLEKSLTDQILMDKLLDKWDGKLPTVTGENGAMFDLSGLLEQKKESE